ncbi:MAG: hypothetical protein Q7J84_03955 [Sulfuricaulis sp.]|nr:hypothetical protein [Sulfuricaulis sp.]
MAKLANVGSRVYIDQYALSGFLNSLDMSVTQETPVVSTLSDSGPRRLVGNYDHSHSHSGFFDGDTLSFDSWIHALVENNSDHYLLELFGANAEGNIAYESVVALEGKPLSGAIAGAVLLNQAYQGRNAMSRGRVIRNGTISANGNGTGQNIGASSATQTFQVVIRVMSGTFTSFDVNVQESQSDPGDPYATVADLSQTGINAAGVWRKTYVGATEAYKRVNIANWIGTDALVLVTAGIVAGT